MHHYNLKSGNKPSFLYAVDLVIIKDENGEYKLSPYYGFVNIHDIEDDRALFTKSYYKDSHALVERKKILIVKDYDDIYTINMKNIVMEDWKLLHEWVNGKKMDIKMYLAAISL